MDTFTLMDAGNENNSRQDTTDDDATPTNNTLVICEDADGTAEVEIDLSLTPTNANVGYLFHWQIEGGGWTPANGDFSSGAITSVWTNAGGDVNREFTVAVHCDCGAGGNCEYCAYRRMLKIAVFKVDLLQAGFDSMDTNKWVSLKKTGSDTYTNDTYISDGNTAITNPVWQDLNLNDIPDVNPPDPVCFVKEAVPMIVQGKLDIKPGIGTNVIDAQIKVEATPMGAAGTLDNLTFGPEDITLASSNVTLAALSEAGGKTVGSVVNNFKYVMVWTISFDNGNKWQTFQTTTQQVFVVNDKPQSDYCSNIDHWTLPYTWSDLAWTAKRMYWATTNSAGENTGDGMASKVAGKISDNPGFLGGSNSCFDNPFTQLDMPDPEQEKMCHRGDCITLANLAATALRLVGTNACPGRAFCNNSNSVDASETWGWTMRIHPVHDNWLLGYPDNNFEGYFYYGVANPPSSSNFPAKGWTVWPVTNATMAAGKEKFLPTAILSNVPVGQLQWRMVAATNGPDVEWSSNGVNAISGVLVDQDPVGNHCTNWTVGADGPYPIGWEASSSNLTLNGGTSVNITYSGSHSLSCSNGSILVYTTLIELPDNTQTETVSIVPARMLAPVP